MRSCNGPMQVSSQPMRSCNGTGRLCNGIGGFTIRQSNLLKITASLFPSSFQPIHKTRILTKGAGLHKYKPQPLVKPVGPHIVG